MTDDEKGKCKHDGKEKKDCEETIERIFLENFGFSLCTLDDLYDSLEDVRDIIKNYVETIHVSDDSRENIGRLSIDADLALLNYVAFSGNCTKYINEGKKEFHLGKKANIPKSEAEEISRKYEETRQKILTLIAKTKEYVQKLKGQS